MKAGTVIAGLVAAGAVAGGAWWGFGQPDNSAKDLTVEGYTQAESRSITSTVLATGIIRLRVGAEVRVGSQLSGIVDQLNVVVGSKVEQGDVIARIDARGLQSRLNQANAQVRVLQQAVKRAEVQLDRARQLDTQGLAPANDIEDRQLDLADAQARLEKARQDAAVVATDLQYAVIQAPIAGTIASVSTQKGETVAASFETPTFATIIAEDALELVAMVDETDIGTVQTSNPVYFTVEAFPAKEFTGTVKQIAPKGTIISGVVNFEVMIEIDSPVELLKPDMTANVSIRTAKRDALVLPTRAIQRDGFEQYVYVEENGELVRRAVSVGNRDAGYSEIRQGIDTSDKVALVTRNIAEPG
ncbi:MAG: efflux RND transporter periplasmic adaptor subunit [Gammaproteobacteria bacterium]|nr:efflux RND transporter periplasmic adaptor subunit [Gammaproteobacteria bacterium]